MNPLEYEQLVHWLDTGIDDAAHRDYQPRVVAVEFWT